PPVADTAAARGWLDGELATLLGVAAHGVDNGWPSHAIRLADTLYRYLDAGALYPEAVAIHTHARHAARNTGERAAEAAALTSRSFVVMRQGHCEQAVDDLQQALVLSREVADRACEARALHNLGAVEVMQGCYQRATDHFKQALAAYRETGNL